MASNSSIAYEARKMRDKDEQQSQQQQNRQQQPKEEIEEEWRELMGDDVKMIVLRAGDVSAPTAEMGKVVYCRDVTMRRVAGRDSDSGSATEEAGGGDAPSQQPHQSPSYENEEEGKEEGELVDFLDELRAEIGKGDVVPGLELALRHGRAGDRLRVRVAPKFAWGPAARPASAPDRPALPASSTVEYVVEVVRISSASEELPEQPEQQTLYTALLRKESGNTWFRFREFLRAGRQYSEGAELAGNYLASCEDEATAPAELVRARVDCLNNLSACYVSLGDFPKARDVCVKVLQADPDNLKALLRAARASLGLHEHTECALCLDRLAALDPSHPSLPGERARLQQARRAYQAKERQMARNISSRLFTPAADKDGPQQPSPLPPTLGVRSEEREDTVPSSGTADRPLQEQPQLQPQQALEQQEKHGGAIIEGRSGSGSAKFESEGRSLLLIGTSLAVLAISLLVAYYLSTLSPPPPPTSPQ